MNHVTTNPLRWLLLIAFAAAELSAQSAQISGQVIDSSGKVVLDAKVTATSTETGLQRLVSTNEAGYYFMPALQPGDYELTVQKDGFRMITRKGIRLTTNERVRIDFSLELGSVTQSIIVTDVVSERVETDSGTVGRLVDGSQVRELALNGRNSQQMLMLLPGVVTTTDEFDRGGVLFGNVGSFNFNGLRGSTTTVTVDGGANQDIGGATPQTNSVGVDFVREVKVASSGYSAEYGRYGGAQMSVTTRSGTEAYHGTLFEFFRNDDLNARNFFSPRMDKMNMNNFGWNLGGPVVLPWISTKSHKKLFFFAGQEYKRRIDSTTSRVTMPSRAQRDGIIGGTAALRYPANFPDEALRGMPISDPSRGTPDNPLGINILPRRYMTDNGRAIMKVFDVMEPLASLYTDTATANNTTFQFSTRDIRRQDVIKIDYHASARNQFSFRRLYDTGSNLPPSANMPTNWTTRRNTAQNLQFVWTWVGSASTLNEFGASSVHLRLLNLPTGDLRLPETYGLKFSSVFDNYTSLIGMKQISGVGTAIMGSYWAGSPMWDGSIRDTFSLLRGKHQLRMGFILNRARKNQWNYNTGAVAFSTASLYSSGNQMIDALLGNFSTWSETNQLRYVRLRFTQLESFVAETWRVRPNLTLDIGARFQFMPAHYAADNALAVFRPERFDFSQAQSVYPTGSLAGQLMPGAGKPYNGLCVAGDKYLDPRTAPTDPAAQNLFCGLPRGIFDAQNKVSPRFGFAWDVFGNGTFALRGGGAVYYERPYLDVGAGLSAPFLKTVTLYNGHFDNPGAGVTGEFPVAITSPRHDTVAPATYNWNIGFQKQLPRRLLLDLNYVSTQGRHLERRIDINQVTPAVQYPNRTRNINSLRAYQGYTNIFQFENSAASNYHSLQTGLTRRYTDLTFSVAYTWSKVLTDASAPTTGVENLQNYRAERSHATFDRNHVMVMSYTYNLPLFKHSKGLLKIVAGGWQVSGITQFQMGAWLTPLYSTPTGSRRPDRVGDVRYLDPRQVQTLIGGSGGTRTAGNFYFDPTPGTTFIEPPLDQYGNSGPQVVRGPGRNNWDLSMFKNFQLQERLNLQFRGELFNAWNHAQFRNPNMTANDLNYATIADCGPPRLVQFGLKLVF